MPFWKSKTNRIYTYAARHVRRRTHFSVRRLLISALVGFSAAARPKELAHDYLEREQSTDPTLVAGLVVAALLEAELKAPGRERVYLHSSIQKFGTPGI
jgi:hypothetical protein